MQLLVLANDSQMKELLNNRGNNQFDLTVIQAIQDLDVYKDADGVIDLLFDGSGERIELLKKFSNGPVIVNSVVHTLNKINAPFTRINGWPGFLQRSIVEASTNYKKARSRIENIFLHVGKEPEWVPDIPGFITARVVAMIINEAWFTLYENISTRQEIDAAMRLGTNYPYGPFEWCEKIGAKNVCALLQELAKKNPRYDPNTLLAQQAIN